MMIDSGWSSLKSCHKDRHVSIRQRPPNAQKQNHQREPCWCIRYTYARFVGWVSGSTTENNVVGPTYSTSTVKLTESLPTSCAGTGRIQSGGIAVTFDSRGNLHARLYRQLEASPKRSQQSVFWLAQSMRRTHSLREKTKSVSKTRHNHNIISFASWGFASPSFPFSLFVVRSLSSLRINNLSNLESINIS